MEATQIYRQVYNCKQGEKNLLTKEIYCNRYQEFCKHVGECPVKSTFGKIAQISKP